MRRKRSALVALLAGAALVLMATPAAAQAPSRTADLINSLNGKLLYIGLPITLLVEVILIYTVIRFRNNDEPEPTRENRRLEITWTVATAIILLFVGVASYGVLANENVTYLPSEDQQNPGPSQNENAVVVNATSYQWNWTMSYPQHNISGTAQDGTPLMVIPKNQDVYIRVTSQDVLHAYHVPKLALKQDAFPGQMNTIKTVATEEGTYQGYCAEFCGVAHSQMYFLVKVVSQQEYQQWVQNHQGNSSGGGGAGNASAGGNNSTAGGGNNSTATANGSNASSLPGPTNAPADLRAVRA